MAVLRPAVVALGMFDGVHTGHQELLQTAASFAEMIGARCCVYTFLNHPSTLLGGHSPLLTGTEERRALLTMFGADEVFMEPFDRNVMRLSPEDFIRRLFRLWDVRGLVAGFNYTFGDHGAGTAQTLIALGESFGYSAIIVPPVEAGGGPVSSSRIRRLLSEGDARGAALLLGRPYSVGGTVTPNRQNGRRLGFPTANLLPQAGRALPKRGVYVTDAVCAAGVYRAVTNVGTNPTVHGDHVTIETHLLDFSGDLYGRELEIRFLHYLRPEQPFPSVDALRAQIACDADSARRFRAK